MAQPDENLALIMKDGKVYKNTVNGTQPKGESK